jgi:hypothetical protein
MQIESFSIEQLAELRDRVNTLLAERVSDRQRELSSEARDSVLSLLSRQCQKLLKPLLRSRSTGRATTPGRAGALNPRG